MFKKLIADKEALQYIFSKGGITFSFRIVAMALGFVVMWIMTNFFGKTVWGLYTLALTVLQITAMFFAMGLPNAFVRFSGEYTTAEQPKGLLLKSAKLALLSSLVPVIIFTVGSGFIASYIFEKEHLYHYLLIVAVGVPCMIIHEIICYYFLSIKKFVIYGLSIFVLPNTLFIGLLLILYYTTVSGYYTFLAYVIAYIVTIIIGLAYIYGKKRKVILPELSSRNMLRTSLPMMVSGIFIMLLNWTDVLMLGRFETEEKIGIYNTAFKIGYLSLFFVLSMNTVLMPKAAELFSQNNMTELKKVINRATQLVILLTIPLALFLIFFNVPLLNLFGDGFAAGSTSLTIIVLGGVYNAMTGNVDQILNMTDNQNSVSIILFTGFVLNVILNLFLIPAYSIEGAATASLITNIYVNTVFVIVIRKKLGFYTFI